MQIHPTWELRKKVRYYSSKRVQHCFKKKKRKEEKTENFINCLERAYLKIDKHHWVLSSPANMWIEFHTKSTTLYSSDIDVYALLLFVVHCYSCDDLFLMCCNGWRREKKLMGKVKNH